MHEQLQHRPSKYSAHRQFLGRIPYIQHSFVGREAKHWTDGTQTTHETGDLRDNTWEERHPDNIQKGWLTYLKRNGGHTHNKDQLINRRLI